MNDLKKEFDSLESESKNHAAIFLVGWMLSSAEGGDKNAISGIRAAINSGKRLDAQRKKRE